MKHYTFTINNDYELSTITLGSIMDAIEDAGIFGDTVEFPVDADMCKGELVL